MNGAIVAALVAALASPLLAYFAAARRLSGKINTSEAASLWTEASNLRTEYKDEIGTLRTAIEECTRRLSDMEKRNQELYLENGNLRRMIEQHEKTIAALRDENADLRARVKELEANR